LGLSGLKRVVAIVGLLLDTPVMVIGAMLVSPLLGPITGIVVNASLGRLGKMVRAEYSIATLLAASFLVSLTLSLVISRFSALSIGSETMLRTNPRVVDVLVAVLLGVAGGMALVRSFAETLVGVAVADSLIPPVAAAGVVASLRMTELLVGSLILVLVNLIGLQVDGLLVMMLKGVESRISYDRRRAIRYRLSTLLVLLTMLIILSAVIIYFIG